MEPSDNRDSTVVVTSVDIPLLIEFAPASTLHRERDRPSHFPIHRNGPAGTFVIVRRGLRVSLPTDQIVCADDADGRARVGFGGMQFVGMDDGQLLFRRVRDLRPEHELSPARSHTMRLDVEWVTTIRVAGRPVWPIYEAP